MKVFKKSLCILMSVVILFFSINNSYFSPDKMDTVEASSIVVGSGAVIAVDTIIKLVAALAVAGLAVGVIVEWTDMDIEQLVVDVHTWCKENYDSISGYLEAQPAIKEWILSDYWVVVADFASGSSPEPSPSPDDEKENLPSTGQEETGLTQEEFEELLNEQHGFSKAFKGVALGTATGITLTSILEPLSYIAEYEHYVDAEGNILDDDDPRIKSVLMENDISMIAQAYMQSKIDDYSSDDAGTDPVTQALQSRYQIGKEFISGYSGIVPQNEDGTYAYTVSIDGYYGTTNLDHNEGAGYLYDEVVGSMLVTYVQFPCYIKLPIYRDSKDELSYKILYSDGSIIYSKMTANFPIFESEEAYRLWKNGDTSIKPINEQRKYQDPDNDYGWIDTADISLDDLEQTVPGIMRNLIDRSVSIPALVAAINSLKGQLEEKNPNTDPAVVPPRPYPTVEDYSNTLQDIITDPDIFPESEPAVDPAPDPDPETETAPDSDTMKDYSGFLGKIITLLQNILQAIKDFFAWFIIDFDAIKQHLLLALSSLPAFSGYEDFLALVDSAKGQITDSYDYPVIEMDTPQVLLPFYKQATIVLLDFEDYAKYFIWVRTAMSFAILFGFCMWVIRDIRVSFTLN